MKPPMHDPDQRHELIAVVLHEKNVAIADFELWRITHLNRFAVHSSSQHLDCVTLSRGAFDRIFDPESHIGDDAPFRARTDPERTRGRDSALENQLRIGHELVKRGRNNGSGANACDTKAN